MAQAANIVWEVRTTGASTNGGGFLPGATGTDWSQQAAAQYSVTDGVTAGTTTITSATANFGTDVVGNVIYVAGGTGSVAANWYEITARTNATTITVDRSTGLTAGTGVTLKIGGALNALTTLDDAMQTYGQWAFVKADGTYTQTATPTLTPSGTQSSTLHHSRLIGYTTTRGDSGRASIVLSTNSGLYGMVISGSGWIIENFDVNCSSLTTSNGIYCSLYYNTIKNCKVSNFRSIGLYSGSQLGVMEDNEVTGGISGATAAVYVTGGSNTITRNWVHDNVCTGISTGGAGQGSITHNLVTNNTGASSDGISTVYNTNISYNTVYGSGRYGIYYVSPNPIALHCRGNIVVNSGTAGFVANSTAAIPAHVSYDGNAYYNNGASGDRFRADLTTNIPGPYTNIYDITLLGSPFINPAANDFRLNNQPGRGAACKRQKMGVYPGTTGGYSYADLGCYQSDLEPTPLTKRKN